MVMMDTFLAIIFFIFYRYVMRSTLEAGVLLLHPAQGGYISFYQDAKEKREPRQVHVELPGMHLPGDSQRIRQDADQY